MSLLYLFLTPHSQENNREDSDEEEEEEEEIGSCCCSPVDYDVLILPVRVTFNSP